MSLGKEGFGREEVENLKMEGEGMKMSRRPFLGGVPKWTIFTWKNHFTPGKNREN